MWHSVGNGEGFTPDHLPLTAPAVHLKEENSMKARMSFVVMTAVLTALVLAPASQAQTTTPPKPMTRVVAMKGTKSFKGKYAIDHFARSKSGKLVAVGT